MRKAFIMLLILAALITAAFPAASFTEDEATVRLARVMYAVAGRDSYEAKLALGSLVMNRVESPWFPGTLSEVLKQQQQFPAGREYDAESLRAAHEVISGARTLPEQAVYYQPEDASNAWTETPTATVGSLNFFDSDGNK